MRAIVRDTYGSTDGLELRDIERPEIGDDEVLIRVRAAGVDRGVWHLMTGLPYPIRLAGYGLRTPKSPVPGRDAGRGRRGDRRRRDPVRARRRGVRHRRRAPSPSTRALPRPSSRPSRRTSPSSRPRRSPISGLTALQAVRDKAQVAAGTDGADHRRVGRRRHVRRADRQGLRRRGHRRLQHEEGRPGPLARRRPRHRLHPRGLRGRASGATT